jgi:hypothetical protein
MTYQAPRQEIIDAMPIEPILPSSLSPGTARLPPSAPGRLDAAG